MVKDNLNQLVRIQLQGRSNSPIVGILLAYTSNWILIKKNLVDYLMDGYELINRKKVISITTDADLLFIQEVLKAKHVNFEDSPVELHSNIFITLEAISLKYGAFCLEFKDQSSCLVGRFMGNDDQSCFAFEELAPNGEWIEEIDEFDISKIYKIDFDGDYTQSLLLFANKKVNG